MDIETVVASLFGIIIVLLLVGSGLAGRYFERRKWERRFAELSSAMQRDGTDSVRMERLEQAVESIAVELERVGEGQRFVTKLLADRAAAKDRKAPVS